MTEHLAVDWDGGRVSGRLEGEGATGVLLAHGAGTNQDHPFIAGVRHGLATAGCTVLSFNYPYTERGSKRPDRTETLLACHRAAADALAGRVGALVMAGRSMGGRMATYLAADGYPCRGLVLYSYPLHPAGKPDRLRVEHLSSITVPMLFFQGTRDSLSRMDLFEAHVGSLAGATIDLMEGAGHGMTGGGWTRETSLAHVVEVTTAWIDGLLSGRAGHTRP